MGRTRGTDERRRHPLGPRRAARPARTVVEASGAPLHVHLSEQVAENDACLAAYGVTPTRLLADAGVLGPLTTAVHATHLTDDDIELLGDDRHQRLHHPDHRARPRRRHRPGRALHDAGSPLTLGSDSHAVIDPFEEMRALELDERLATRRARPLDRRRAARRGHRQRPRSLGYDDAGRIAVGPRADLVTLDTASPRTAGTGARRAHRGLRGHRRRRHPGRRRRPGRLHAGATRSEIGRELDAAIGALWT